MVMPHSPLINRIRGEFLEMPGLRLTLAQAQRLCGVERALCQRVLGTLVETGLMCVKTDGTYTRLTDGADSLRSSPEKAALQGRVHSEKAS